ncbi:hypothetical protein [Flammeovirga aprica]|uniref:Uncharacterized protein n=1 Tax=Flammeovirga aprica JL-4 TaxID=694437 RepID=A0A7X9RY86_9BACT|nr:hypothetical protein [Flammeovirga aprica]NME70950.1 hypothetical protein [Flammeovirga aprica JL-4]
MQKMIQYPLRITYAEAKGEYGDHNTFKGTLTSNELQFIEDRKIEGRFSLGELYHLIHKSSLYYTLIKGKRDHINGYGIFGSLALAAAAFLAYVKEVDWLLIVLIVALIGSIILTIQLRKRTKYEPFEMNNDEVLKGLIYVLIQDFGPKLKVNLSMDCTPLEVKDKIVDKFRRRGRNFVIYKKEYLRLKFSLGNSVKVILQDDYFCRKQSWTKRSRSGKTKHKSKENQFNKVAYNILFDSQKYEPKPNVEENGMSLEAGMWVFKGKFKTDNGRHKTSHLLNEQLKHLQQPFLQMKRK